MVHVRIASGHSVRVSGHGNIGRSALRLRSGRASDSRRRALRFGAQAVVGPRPDIPASAAARAVATRLLGTYPKPAICCAGRRRYAGPASWGGRQGRAVPKQPSARAFHCCSRQSCSELCCDPCGSNRD